MLPLLQHLSAALTSDTGLTTIVPATNIAATLRNPADWPAIEYGIEEQQRNNKGQIRTSLVLYIHSTEGAAQCWEIQETIHRIMTAENLTNAGTTGIRISRTRMIDARRQPRNEWAASIRVVYDIHVINPNDTFQHQ